MNKPLPFYLIILAGFLFSFTSCQAHLPGPAKKIEKTVSTKSATTEVIPSRTITPDLYSTAIIQTLIAPTTYAQSYYRTLTALPINIDPLISDFNGNYLYGADTGPFGRIIIDPNGLFTYIYTNDIGPHGRVSGELSVQDGSFILSPKLQLGDNYTLFSFLDPSSLSDEEIIPVLWGDRRYLVPGNDIPGFCNMVNRGWEPRDREWGFTFLNLEDVSKRAGEISEFPNKISWCILPEPITGLVTQMDDDQVTVNLGSNQGVFEGMILFTNSVDYCYVHIKSVNVTESLGKIYFDCDIIEVGVTQITSIR